MRMCGHAANDQCYCRIVSDDVCVCMIGRVVRVCAYLCCMRYMDRCEGDACLPAIILNYVRGLLKYLNAIRLCLLFLLDFSR